MPPVACPNPVSHDQTTTADSITNSLAYAEMRLILARVLWNFDMTLAPGEDGIWIERQRVFLIWDKVPLMVDLTVVER